MCQLNLHPLFLIQSTAGSPNGVAGIHARKTAPSVDISGVKRPEWGASSHSPHLVERVALNSRRPGSAVCYKDIAKVNNKKWFAYRLKNKTVQMVKLLGRRGFLSCKDRNRSSVVGGGEQKRTTWTSRGWVCSHLEERLHQLIRLISEFLKRDCNDMSAMLRSSFLTTTFRNGYFFQKLYPRSSWGNNYGQDWTGLQK